MSARTVAPANSHLRHPHSRGTVEKIRRWLFADPTLQFMRLHQVSTLGWVKFWTARAVRYSWLRRDIAPGIYTIAVFWLWTRSPITFGPHPPRLPAVVLVTVGAAVGYWSLQHRDQASEDRAEHRADRIYQNACLDSGLYPIPDRLWRDTKPHVTLIGIAPIAGSINREVWKKIEGSMRSVYRKPVHYKQNDDGTGVISIQNFDPLKQDPILPAYLGNEDGPAVYPTWRRFPLGIDADGEILTITLFETHILSPGAQRTGKSITAAAAAIGMLAAPDIEPWGIDPQVVSLRCLKGHAPFASTIEGALDLLRDFHQSMEKREAEMDEQGTSLAVPSRLWPLKVLLIDELLRFIDPDLRDELDGKYATIFLGLLKDVLRAGPKTGHVIWATTTDPRQKVLADGIRDLFTTRIIFRTADSNASSMTGVNVPGYRPHELPATPGRAILRCGAETVQCRTWGVWDVQAVEAARQAAVPMPTVEPSTTSPPAAPWFASGPEPLSNPNSFPNPVVPTSSRLRRGEARTVIIDCLRQHGPLTIAKIAELTGLTISTVKRWVLGADGCSDPIPVQSLPRHRYALIGDDR